MRASDSLASSLGVVPEDTSACQPDAAPHAMVMNRNGNRLPANTGPVASMKRVTAGICSCGIAITTATASSTTVPILRKALR